MVPTLPRVCGVSVGLREVDGECAGELCAAADVVEEGEGPEGVRVDQVDDARVLVVHLLLQFRRLCYDEMTLISPHLIH